MKDTPKVSVIIVNWNGLKYLSECLNAIFNQTYPDYEVIFVDNGSTDGSVEYVERNFPQARIVRNKENLGFAGGNNQGAEAASGELLALLNNDTVVERDWLGELVEAIQADERIGAAMSNCYYDLETKVARGDRVSTLNILGKHIHVNPIEVPLFYAGGASMIYRRELRPVPFDDMYFAYDEDVYLSWYLRLVGYDIAFAEKSLLYHEVYGTSKRIRDHVVYMSERNRTLNLLLFYEKRTLLKILPLLTLTFIAKALTFRRGMKHKLKAYLWFPRNLGLIQEKRREIQSKRRVSDEVIVRYLICKLAENGARGAGIVNRVGNVYCRLLRIKA